MILRRFFSACGRFHYVYSVRIQSAEFRSVIIHLEYGLMTDHYREDITWLIPLN